MPNDSLFDFDAPLGAPGTTDLSFADDRTLRLAVHPFSEDELEGLVRFQEAFLARTEASIAPSPLAAAHPEAQEASGLKPRRVEQGLALLRLFCGKRWTVQKLRRKLEELSSAGPEKDALRDRIHEELDRLERETDDLGRRFGPELLLLLRRHEGRLLSLHTRMTAVLSRG